MWPVDDIEIGRRFRAVRISKGWRQQDVAAAAGVSDSTVSRVERGQFEDMTVGTLRRIGRVLGVRIEVLARWRGGDLDRTVNARHAALHEAAAIKFAPLDGWIAVPEVTFNIYGERGAIDVLAWHAGNRALLVVELKAEIVDIQQLIGAVDRYRRLAPRIARERGWLPVSVSTWLALAAGRTNARSVAAHRTVLNDAFPDDGRRLAAWLRHPVGRLDALGSLSYSRRTSVGRDLSTPKRVRRPHRPS
jgi:transcriptional regulator with XRE-family HTH domain